MKEAVPFATIMTGRDDKEEVAERLGISVRHLELLDAGRVVMSEPSLRNASARLGRTYEAIQRAYKLAGEHRDRTSLPENLCRLEAKANRCWANYRNCPEQFYVDQQVGPPLPEEQAGLEAARLAQDIATAVFGPDIWFYHPANAHGDHGFRVLGYKLEIAPPTGAAADA